MKRRLLYGLLLLTLLALLSGCSGPAEKTALPDGESAAEDFVIEDGVVTAYKGTVGHAIIPEGVTGIADTAFSNAGITRVTFPDSLRSIGEKAFIRCDFLEEVIIPEGVLDVGDSAFYSCGSLKRADIRAPLDQLPAGLFQYCGSLESVSLPDSVQAIGKAAFSGTALTEIHWPAAIESIGSEAFYGSGIRQLQLPAGLRSIGSRAFAANGLLEAVLYTGNGLVVGENAFFNCPNLTSVSLPPDTLLLTSAFRDSDKAGMPSPSSVRLEYSQGEYAVLCIANIRMEEGRCLVTVACNRIPVEMNLTSGTAKLLMGAKIVSGGVETAAHSDVEVARLPTDNEWNGFVFTFDAKSLPEEVIVWINDEAVTFNAQTHSAQQDEEGSLFIMI